MPQNFVIIVAAGTGSRIGGNLPKQFLNLHDKPILMHTIEKFEISTSKPEIILVLSNVMQDFWVSQCKEYNFTVPHSITIGGLTRFQSVKNGLEFIKANYKLDENCKIAVHDAARPLVSSHLIDELFQNCNLSKPAIIPAVKSSNSVRIGNQHESQAVDRETIWLVQTPQVFMADLLLQAYHQEEESTFTDDASVVEKLSNNVFLIPGDPQNMKITFQEDLVIAQHLFNKSKRYP